MERTPVESSSLLDVGYDPGTGTLEVGFKNGTVYQYFDVPETTHIELMNSASKGIFFNANVRNSFRSAKL
jgi:hypothetical protein